ncbi:MAG: FHA domain-containing protein, partial [Planctomycetes bacterium]|nr:FHA domain-containing protein [Planctomycetota bacterium]
MLHLIIKNEGIGQKSIALDTSKTYALGRFAGDITLEFEPKCSNRHATLKFDGAKWKLVDEMSDHGTFVNGREVNFVEFTPGVVAKIGDTTFEVADPSAPAAPVDVTPSTPSAIPATQSILATPQANPKIASKVKAPKVNTPNLARDITPATPVTTSSAAHPQPQAEPEVKLATPSTPGGKSIGAAQATAAAMRGGEAARKRAIVGASLLLLSAVVVSLVLINSGGDPAPQQQNNEARKAPERRALIVDRGSEANGLLAKAKAMSDPQARYSALTTLERDYLDDVDSTTAGEIGKLLREAREAVNEQIKSILTPFVAKADKMYPLGSEVGPATHNVIDAARTIEAMLAEIAKLESENIAFHERAVALGFDTEASKRLQRYQEDSEEYLADMRAKAAGLELSARFQLAAEILGEALGRVYLDDA